MKESVTYQAILEEGEVQEAKRILRLLGSKRFGRPDRRTAAALEAIHDLEHLETLSVRLLTANSWDELLEQPARRRRNGRRPRVS